jgi:hypothetical protein
MPSVARCPGCATELDVGDDVPPGEPVECPVCLTRFVPDRPPARARPRDEDEFDDDDRPRRRRRAVPDPAELIDEAKQAVFLPGLFTVLVSGLGMMLAGLEIVLIVAAPQLMVGNPFLKWWTPEALIAVRVVAILWEAMIVAGAGAMMRLRSYRFAYVVMAMRVIPFAGLCCILGFPFGIWGLVALGRPEVRDGFEEAARARRRRRDESRPDDEDEAEYLPRAE